VQSTHGRRRSHEKHPRTAGIVARFANDTEIATDVVASCGVPKRRRKKVGRTSRSDAQSNPLWGAGI
jgi:hypothetical protein